LDITVNPKLWKIILFIPILFISFAVHEFAHAFVAVRFGDDTPRREGRLTLNPLSHLDLIGSILVPFMSMASGWAIIGWAKPVRINRNNFHNPLRDDIWVSLAGPAANFILAILISILIKLGFPRGLLRGVLELAVYFNVFLFFFNLLPIPPLDGSHILFDVFPNYYTQRYLNIGGGLGLVLLFVFIYSPLWNWFMELVNYFAFSLL